MNTSLMFLLSQIFISSSRSCSKLLCFFLAHADGVTCVNSIFYVADVSLRAAPRRPLFMERRVEGYEDEVSLLHSADFQFLRGQ